MSHKHHIIPKHAGGTDDPSNLVELSVDDHAEAHRKLYEEYGRWQDYVAWQGLAKLSPKEELVRIRQREAAKLRHQLHPNPFTDIRTKSNFAVNKEHQKQAGILSKTAEAMEKRKKTLKEIKHQQKENNSNFGKVWCVEEIALDLSDRKMYNKEQIPLGWISTTEWADRRKNKNNNAYGRHWYNDGKKNYYLKPNDVKIEELNLEKRRMINKNIIV
jgi:hypothetical protein